MCGKTEQPAIVAFLHKQPPLFCSLVKGGHRGTYGWSRFINLWHPYPRLLYRPSKRNPTSFDIFRHATDSYAFAPRTSVEWVDRIPPLPETSATSWFEHLAPAALAADLDYALANRCHAPHIEGA